jgi:hypothetical protein
VTVDSRHKISPSETGLKHPLGEWRETAVNHCRYSTCDFLTNRKSPQKSPAARPSPSRGWTPFESNPRHHHSRCSARWAERPGTAAGEIALVLRNVPIALAGRSLILARRPGQPPPVMFERRRLSREHGPHQPPRHPLALCWTARTAGPLLRLLAAFAPVTFPLQSRLHPWAESR